MKKLSLLFAFAVLLSQILATASCLAIQQLPNGFDPADSDNSESVSSEELKKYLLDRLNDDSIPFQKVFDRIDANNDNAIDRDEFENRHEAILHFMGENYFGSNAPQYKDPGKQFVPYEGIGKATHDAKIMGAVIHRFKDLKKDPSIKWPEDINLKKLPQSVSATLVHNTTSTERRSVKDMVDATVVLCGGSGVGFFTAGAVVISSDGLAVTNYHVAEFMDSGKMGALTSDGKFWAVVELLAGDQEKDVALIRLGGSDFQHVPIARTLPLVGDDIELLHHSENRFFTYDRGYVMRHPTLGKLPWMEISADYAPGGSGCGIYNKNRELVGLVSVIQYGDGPSLSLQFDMREDDGGGGFGSADGGESNDSYMDSMLMMKHAVPLTAIRSLWSQPKTKKTKAINQGN